MDSIFTKIINGEIPCHKVDETDKFIAFLDINPKAEGHTLVVPKKQVDRIWDLDQELYKDLWFYVKELALHIEKKIPCVRVGLWVEGLEVPHTHVHLVPMGVDGFVGLGKTDVNNDPEHLSKIAERLRG